MRTHALNPAIAQLLKVCGMDRTWVEGRGVQLVDDKGRRFLDFYSQYGAVSLGHNHPAILEAVKGALADGLPAMVQPYRAPHAVALAEALGRVTPGNLPHCIFTTSGAQTVETALKLVRMKTGRPLVLSARGSFHGKTLGALSVTGQRHYAEAFGPLPRGVQHVPYGDVAALTELFRKSGERIAAFFVEPIQGEGGVIEPPPGYLLAAQRLCREHGAALVVDEIQTGLGRTGKLFACDHEGVVPDILLLAKSLGGGVFPLGACLVSDLFWDDRFDLLHSSTFANNNIACKVGLTVIELLTTGDLCRQSAERGQHLQARLERLAGFFPRTIREVRGRGMLGAIELRPVSAQQSCLLSYFGRKGLYAYMVAGALAESASVLTLPTLGKRPVLRVAPPLTISEEQLDEGMDAIEELFERLESNPAGTIIDSLGIVHRPAPLSPLTLPSRPARREKVDFAFLIHYTRPEDILLTDPGLSHLSPTEVDRFSEFTSQFPPGVVLKTPVVRSVLGSQTRGCLITVPLLPEQMVSLGRRYVNEQIAQAVDLAVSLGAKVVGLGGYTTPFSRRGQAVTGRGAAITTGNALTAGSAMASLAEVAGRQGLDLRGARVGVVGAGGSVAKLCARWMARLGVRELVLVGNPRSGLSVVQSLAQSLAADKTKLSASVSLVDVMDCDAIVTASGAVEPILDTLPCQPGAIICDIARPADTSAHFRSREGVTVFEGGLIALPDPSLQFGAGNLTGLPDGIQLACLAETMLLAMEGQTQDHGVGDDVPLSALDTMLQLADKHGFLPAYLGGGATQSHVSAKPQLVMAADSAEPAAVPCQLQILRAG